MMKTLKREQKFIKEYEWTVGRKKKKSDESQQQIDNKNNINKQENIKIMLRPLVYHSFKLIICPRERVQESQKQEISQEIIE